MQRKHRVRAYLSGGMEYAPNEGADWRKEMSVWLDGMLGHVAFNPNEESKKLLKRLLPKRNLRAMKAQNTKEFIRIVRQIVKIDSAEIARRSDYVICYWDEAAQKGAGTKGEVTLARYFNKPVYVVTEMDLTKIPGWILGCATHFVRTFDELKTLLATKYGHHKRRSRKKSAPTPTANFVSQTGDNHGIENR